MALPNSKLCNATAKSTGLKCRNPAVTGSEKCRLHGGLTPRGSNLPQFKHGRYSKYLPDNLLEKVDSFEDSNALDLLDDLNVQRALLSDYTNRFKAGKLTASDIAMLFDWIEKIGRMVERITRIRNETALTATEIAYLKTRTVDLVTKYIDDPEKRRQFVIELFQINESAQLE